MGAVMAGVNIAQPDITLILDLDGVIEEARIGGAIGDEELAAWRGRPWVETVAEVGSAKVRRMLDDACSSGVSAFRQVTQRFPSGRELPIEYTAVRLGGKAGLIAIGRSLQAVAELQSRLIAAQQVMERDYWKLREVETRYRLLFDTANEAVLLLRLDGLMIQEANPAAIRTLGLASGRAFLPEMSAADRPAFEAMLARVREFGRAPAVLVHLGPDSAAWMVRATLMNAPSAPAFLLQLAPVAAAVLGETRDVLALEELVEHLPDAFAVTDEQGVVRRANRAFLDLVQLPSEAAVLGESLSRWLARPGADLPVLLANLQRHGTVRLFGTTMHGELGADTEVEISAAGDRPSRPHWIALVLHDISRRPLPSPEGDRLHSALTAILEQSGRTSLRKLVRDTVEVVERHCIEAALEVSASNRTAAAELLGLSRQSLYEKLDRYALHGNEASAPADSGG